MTSTDKSDIKENIPKEEQNVSKESSKFVAKLLSDAVKNATKVSNTVENESNVSRDIESDAKTSLLEENASTKELFSASTSGNTSSLSPQKSNVLFRPKEVRDTSPFKEALRGYVLSKLSNKKNPHDTLLADEKKTFISGIKEKLARKLEDPNVSAEVSYTQSDHSIVTQEDIDVPLQELKSVVANDPVTEQMNVEEADECFDESDSTSNREPNFNKGFHNNAPLPLPGSSTPIRSKTIENIYGMARRNKPLSKAGQSSSFSMTFSELQKTDTLDDEEEIPLPVIKTENERNLPESRILPTRNSNATGSETDRRNVSETVIVSKFGIWELIANYYNLLFLSIPLQVWLQLLVMVLAVLVMYILPLNPFLTGLFSGMLIILIAYVFSEVIQSAKQKSMPCYPHYKSLPVISNDPNLEPKELINHEGWMNELIGTYDSRIFSMTTTLSVFVQLRESNITVFYPKRNIAKQAMWNENIPVNVAFIHHVKHSLLGGKVLLLPDSLLERRLWNKRYPIAVVLQKLPLKKFPSIETLCSNLDAEKEAVNVTESPSSCSLPPSLSCSPTHNDKGSTRLYLFARTGREKEEWFSKLRAAAKSPSVNLLDFGIQEAVASASSNTEPDGTIESSLEEEIAKCPKTELLFSDYMAALLQHVPNPSEDTEPSQLLWLNAFVGRLFYDFLTKSEWSVNVKERIQAKLNGFKMPQFMQTLTVTDISLGASMPKIQSVSVPEVDGRGLWIYVDMEYNGSFQLTLETKLRSVVDKSQQKPCDDPKKKENATSDYVLCNQASKISNDFLDEISEEDEDITELVLPKDESGPNLSTGEKLIYSVEKWIQSSNLSENSFVKRCVGHLMQTRLFLIVEVNYLSGTMALNLPNAPSDRLWFGFRENPDLSLDIHPKWGQHNISVLPLIMFLKKKLIHEFQKAVVMPNMEDVIVPIMHTDLKKN